MTVEDSAKIVATDKADVCLHDCGAKLLDCYCLECLVCHEVMQACDDHRASLQGASHGVS